jgi:1-aminocyclopropane-1-carboxylate deaminase/D-cysteine desulfhydrase-like pyridoxal-dependent ACC family enzyme
VWAKREDCNSGLAFGGNKTRKLEYLVPDALEQGATHLVSIGGVQSNHTRQVAAVAARLGLKARLVQEGWVDWPDAVNDRVGNILLSRVMGADTADLIGLGRDLRDDEITVLDGWAGDAYGIPVASTLDAIRLTGSLEGVILDPVYEGKSMAALIDLIGPARSALGRTCSTHISAASPRSTPTARCSRADAMSPAPDHHVTAGRSTPRNALSCLRVPTRRAPRRTQRARRT